MTGSRITDLTVLYDAGCCSCRWAKSWLAAQPLYLPLDLVAAGSAEARRRFPRLDHEASKHDLTMVADDGAVYVGERAWISCLWATRRYRALAGRLARQHELRLGRQMARMLSGSGTPVQRQTTPARLPAEDGYGEQHD